MTKKVPGLPSPLCRGPGLVARGGRVCCTTGVRALVRSGCSAFLRACTRCALLPSCSAEPGPWQDVELLAALQQQRQQRLVDTGRPASMTYPPVPGAGGAMADGDGVGAAEAAVSS